MSELQEIENWANENVPSPAQQEIGRLAAVLLEEFGSPIASESACEMAVRVLREQRASVEECLDINADIDEKHLKALAHARRLHKENVDLRAEVERLRQLVYAQELPEGWHEADDASVQLAVDNAELRAKVERLRGIVEGRLVKWESDGGSHKLASPYSHLSVEGELKVILREMNCAALQSAGEDGPAKVKE